MEDALIILSIALIGVFSLVGVRMFRPIDNRKQAKRNVQDTAQKEVIESKDLTIDTLKNELRSLNGKLTRFRDTEPEEEEEDPLDGHKPVTWDEITALVNNTYPKYTKLLPLAKKQIMDATKGMTLDEILSYVKQFTGNQQPQGNTTPESATYNPNWA